MKLFFLHFIINCKFYLRNIDVCLVLVCIIVSFCIFTIISFRCNKRIEKADYWYNCLASLYITAVLSITIFGREKLNEDTFSKTTLSFTLLLNGNISIFYDVLFNVILFIPFGVFLSIKLHAMKSFLFIVLFTSMIELLQAITKCGLFEYVDIVANIFGGAIGIVLLNIFKKIKKRDNE